MILTIYIGNTSIVFGGVEDGETVFCSRLSSAHTRTSDEYAVLMDLTLRQHRADSYPIDGAILGSVVPPLTPVICDAVITATGVKPKIIGPGLKTGLNIRIEDPSELGADYVATAVAAIDTYPLPCITVDMEMATAIGVIDKSGTYIGGAIGPGIMVAQSALASGASKLTTITPEAPESVVGKTTEAAVKSGIVYGAAALLDGMIQRIEDELGLTATVVATGDWADTVIPHCRRDGIINDPDLLMRGMWLIYNKNLKK